MWSLCAQRELRGILSSLSCPLDQPDAMETRSMAFKCGRGQPGVPGCRARWVHQPTAATPRCERLRQLTSAAAKAEQDGEAHGPSSPKTRQGMQPTAPRRLLLGAAGAALLAGCPCPYCRARASTAQAAPSTADAAAAVASRTGWYDRYIAWGMANTMDSYEAALAPVKQQLFAKLAVNAVQGRASAKLMEQQEQVAAGSLALALAPESGVGVTPDPAALAPAPPFQVLELGVGAGPNLKYLVTAVQQACGATASQTPASCAPAGTPAVQVTGIDPNEAMLLYARESALMAGLPESSVQLVEGDAQRLPWPDNTFDAVVCTLVLCTVPDPQRAVAEAKRVLKPSGQLLFIEHVAAKWEDDPWKRTLQEALTPLQGLLAGGCHLNRDNDQLLESSGFSVLNLTRQSLEGVPGIISPHAWGIAIK